MTITKKFFELLPLFKNATVSQFLFLLEHPVNILLAAEDKGSCCFACSLLIKEEKYGKFINECPKFAFEDLKIIYEWFLKKGISGGGDKNFCSDALDVIASLAITDVEKALFLDWHVNNKVAA